MNFYSADDIRKCSYAILFYSDEYLGYNHKRFIKNTYPELLIMAAKYCWNYVDARATGRRFEEMPSLWEEAKGCFIRDFNHII